MKNSPSLKTPGITAIIIRDSIGVTAFWTPVTLLAMSLFLSFFEEEDAEVLFYTALVSFIVGIPAVLWRSQYIRNLFANGVEVTGFIESKSSYKGKSRVRFTYEYLGQKYSGENIVIHTKMTMALISLPAVTLVIDQHEPKHALIRDLYFL